MTHVNPDKIVAQGFLPKTGGEYTMFLQDKSNLLDILFLQDEAFKDLTEEEKSYLLYKDPQFFEDHLSMNNAIIGVMHEGKLIAQSVIVNPTSKHPKTGMVDMVLPNNADKLTILQGVIVHPEYRGNMLMTKMVDAWLEMSSIAGRTHAIAEVTVENHYSWAAFMKEGLNIHSIGVDVSDGAVLYNMCAEIEPLMKKRLSSTFNAFADKNAVVCQKDNIAEQKQIIANGYEAVQFDRKSGNLAFMKKAA